MDMFKRYDNIPEDYIPDNTSSTLIPSNNTIDNKPLKKVYNAKGNFVGLSWKYGDTITLDFSCAQDISVREDAIVFETSGEGPDSLTYAVTGQQAYNTVDCVSWTCVGQAAGVTIWVKDDALVYPTDGDKMISLRPDMSLKGLSVEFYNFRWELIDTRSNFGATDLSVKIDKDMSNTMKPGVYYCIFKETSAETSIVRSKTMLIVE